MTLRNLAYFLIILAAMCAAASVDLQVATMDSPPDMHVTQMDPVWWTMNIQQADAGIEHPQDMRYAVLTLGQEQCR